MIESISRLRELRHALRGYRPISAAGCKLRVHPYDRAFWNKVEAGQWEPETLDLLSSAIGPGTNYCDIGAWVGPTALLARHFGADVTCFEPDPLAYERLLANLRLNGALDVRTFHCALGSQNSMRRMGAMVGSLGKSATSLLGASADQTVTVPCFSWDWLVDSLSLPIFSFIKIDIEGGEVELLPQMEKYLRRNRPKLLLSTHWGFLSQADAALLRASLNSLASIYPRAMQWSGTVWEPLGSGAESSPSTLFFEV